MKYMQQGAKSKAYPNFQNLGFISVCPFGLLRRYVRTNLIFVEYYCVTVPEDALLAVCLLFHRRFCQIQKECHKRNMPSVVDFFPLWLS